MTLPPLHYLLPTACCLLLFGCGKPHAPPPAPALDPAALQHPDVEQREQAFARFAALRTPDALAAVLDALHHEPDDALYRALRGWLRGLPEAQLVVAIPYLRRTTHFQVRVLLAGAMAGKPHPGLVAELQRLCADTEMAVRRQAVAALGKQAPSSLLDDPRAEVRMLAAELLGAAARQEQDWRVIEAAAGKTPRVSVADLPPLFKGRAAAYSPVVAAGMRWLVRHQEDDGRWSGRSHNRRGPGGLPGISHELAYADPALTGLAVAALLAGGAIPGKGRAGVALQRALRYLRRLQHGSGMIGYSESQTAQIRQALEGQTPEPKPLVLLFNHAIATWALVEAAATTRETELEIAAARALRAFHQVRHARHPWSRWLDPEDDVAYAGYTLLALAVARASGELPVEPALFRGVARYIGMVTRPSGRVIHGGKRAFCFGGYDSAATGLFIRQATPAPSAPADERATALLFSRLPAWNGRFPEPPTLEAMASDPGPITNYHYWHFGALALARSKGGGGAWQARLVQVLRARQRRWPWVEEGSWDPSGPWSRVGGRVYATASALLALCAPVAYRWRSR